MMPRVLVALIVTLASASAAHAQSAAPPGMPPAPGSSATANLVLDAMLASARAASINPQAAQSATMNSNVGIQRYKAGDVAGARFSAIQALMEASRLTPSPIPVLQSTIQQPNALQTKPFPLQGATIAAVDANAFVAQARGAVMNCQAEHSPNTRRAATSLTAAERDARAGRYQNVRVEARTAVDLCAQATQQQNQR